MSAERDDREGLEDQRDFLLRSLEDLEREREAGDVDDADYSSLKDDYTHRAAAVIRALEAGAPSGQRLGRPRSSRRLLVGAATLAFALLAGVLMAQASGRRDPGEVATGDVRQSITEQLNEASRLGATGDYEAAIERYDEVLEADPDNAEAAAYRGWMLTLSGEAEAGLEALLAAATASPDYPDVHAFLAIVFFRNGLLGPAERELDRLDALDQSETSRQLTDRLREQLDAARAAIAAATTTTTSAPAS